jgi:hypothetical protein
MGVTIHYRGSLANLDRIEDFEDRVLDLALEMGGQARIWRTANDDDPRRMVRGVLLDLFPGQESTSLLISPEGWLIGLFDIEEAEKGTLAEPPWCWVKTQFGPIEGHVALIEMLAALKREFLPDLEVSDEGDYWETRDLAGLSTKFGQVQAAMEAMADGLRSHGLSREAAEDPSILMSRIERIAELVHRTLARPPEHPPVHWDDEESEFDAPEGDESRWDALYKENRRKQESMQRAIEEHLARGGAMEDAFDAAMLEETSLGLPEEPSDEPRPDWAEEFEAEEDEPWKESLPASLCDEEDGFDDRSRHPLQQQAMDLMLRLRTLLTRHAEAPASHQSILLRGAGDMMGGLAQALGLHEPPTLSGLSIVQLKRALRGAAFASGSLYPLRADGTLDQQTFDELTDTISQIESGIYAELARLRSQREDG